MKTIRIIRLIIFVILWLFLKNSSAQPVPPAFTYPHITGFFAIFVPVGTANDKGFTTNFSKTSTIAFPFGFNLLKSDHLGFSLELVPFIIAQKGLSKLNYLLFHPGIMFRYNHGFTFIPRLAFQSDGRYGLTPVFSKIIIRKKDYQFYVSASEAARFGNNLPSSYTTSLQLGIGF